MRLICVGSNEILFTFCDAYRVFEIGILLSNNPIQNTILHSNVMTIINTIPLKCYDIFKLRQTLTNNFKYNIVVVFLIFLSYAFINTK